MGWKRPVGSGCGGMSLAFCLVMLGGGFVTAADVADSTKTIPTVAANTEAISQSLRKVFDGAPISGLSDLRAMQGHMQLIADKLRKCTVGVQVGNAWGSGVIISKDGYVLTAAHVAGQPNKQRNASITLHDGKEVQAKTLGLFRTLDAGLMMITEEGEYPHAPLGDSA